MKGLLALAGIAALAAVASPLAAQLMQPQPTPPQLPAGVTPVSDYGRGGRAQNTDIERSRVPTPPAPPPDNGPVPLRASGTSPADVSSVDGIVAALYASVSHGEEAQPNFDRMRSLFLQVGMLIPPRDPRSDLFTVLDVDGFEQRVRRSIAASNQTGAPTSFYEREAARKTDCFGNVCQVFSTYESRRAPSDEKPFVRGINSIQLVNDGKRWWIASVAWDTEREDNPIPPIQKEQHP
jgi:hypothetical protein